MSRTRDQLEAYLKELHIKADSLLDVGGSQKPIKDRLGSCDVKDYKTFDLPIPHETILRPDFIGDINEASLYMPEFDVIFCLEVFDYVYDPVMAMHNLRNWLKVGGTMYISFPFVYPVHNPMQEDMLRYTEFAASRLIEKAGMKVEDIFYRTAHAPAIVGLYKSEGMRLARDYKHHDAVGFIFRVTK